MEISEIIKKKQQKNKLNKSDFAFVIEGFLKNKISETQMKSFLKTIVEVGLCNFEIYNLTKTMQNSGGGKTINLTDFEMVADKHSTGGVSDSTTLLVVPIVAASGIKIFKTSGKSLGFTGGTADKILCFNGLKNNISIEKALKILSKTNGCFLTQSSEICPADKKIYELRDKYDLIENIPLIASSIVSKKLASGSNVIIFDVKVGQGAFIKNLKDATMLAKIMTKILKKEGKKTCAVISSMEEPLGNYIGNNLEVCETVEILKSQVNSIDNQRNSNSNLLKLSEILSAYIIKFAKKISFKKAMKEVHRNLKNGKVLSKFKEIVKAQGGSLQLFEEKPKYKKVEIISDEIGYIKNLDTKKLGFLTRMYTEKHSDFQGIELLVRRGKKLEVNTCLAKLYYNENLKQKINFNEIISNYKKCFIINSKEFKNENKLIIKVIY